VLLPTRSIAFWTLVPERYSRLYSPACSIDCSLIGTHRSVALLRELLSRIRHGVQTWKFAIFRRSVAGTAVVVASSVLGMLSFHPSEPPRCLIQRTGLQRRFEPPCDTVMMKGMLAFSPRDTALCGVCVLHSDGLIRLALNTHTGETTLANGTLFLNPTPLPDGHTRPTFEFDTHFRFGGTSTCGRH